MPRFLLFVLTVGLLTSFSLAQSSDRFEVFGGYSYLSSDFTTVTSNGVSGWNASVTFKNRGWLGVVADFFGFYPSGHLSAKAHTFLFGPQVSFRFDRISPFARFLIGDSNIVYPPGSQFFNSSNSLTYGGGGGLDYILTPRLAVCGQADWLHNGFTVSGSQSP